MHPNPPVSIRTGKSRESWIFLNRKLVNLINKLEFEADTSIQTIITTTDILNIEQSGILNTNKNVTNHHLTR